MTSPAPAADFLWLGFFLLAGLGIYGQLLRGLAHRGGKVRADLVSLPDLLVSLVLGGFFAALVLQAVLAARAGESAPSITANRVLPAALVFVMLLAGVIGLLRARGISIAEFLGLRAQPVMRSIVLGVGLLLAASPLLLAATLGSELLLREKVEEQELVTLFRELARKSQNVELLKIAFAAVVVAPFTEEFLFRGYFYPVLKRSIGAVASALVTAALFAAFHVNVAAFPALFLLALCLTIAYESSGSLVVPLAMHTFFNSVQLLLLYTHVHAPVWTP